MHNFEMPCGTPLSFVACENFRELGGYLGLGGKTVKHGLFYRAPALSNLRKAEDIALFASLGIRTVFDFRSTTERIAEPDPVAVLCGARHVEMSAIVDAAGNEVNFDFMEALKQGRPAIDVLQNTLRERYANMPFANPAYKALFAALAAEEVPLLFHCTAGKDRTGIAAALILKALGVSRANIVADYMQTNACSKKGYLQLAEMLKRHFPEQVALDLACVTASVQEESILSTLDEMDARYPDFADFLSAEYAFDRQALERLRAYALTQA